MTAPSCAVPGNAGLYGLLAQLLAYPRDSYRRRVENCRRELTVLEPEAAGLIAEFNRATGELSIEELQELFTSTFDLNPVCSLEVGWHLFGEDYARGSFLVYMRGQLRRFELPESTELPDHVTSVLPVLGRLEAEQANDFAAACVVPALRKMLAGVSGRNNPYENLLGAIVRVLEHRHPVPAAGMSLPVLQPSDGGAEEEVTA